MLSYSILNPPVRSSSNAVVETLESRRLFAAQALLALTFDGRIVPFDPVNPSAAVPPLTVTGLPTQVRLLNIDTRPESGELFALASDNRLYTLNTLTGAATLFADVPTIPLSGTRFAMDFDPALDQLRIVSNAGQNLRVDPDITDAADNGNTQRFITDPNLTNFGSNPGAPVPNVSSLKYSNLGRGSFSLAAPFVGIDLTANTLVRQFDGAPGTFTPAEGRLTTVGALGFDVLTAVLEDGYLENATPASVRTSTLYMIATTADSPALRLFVVDESTGGATLVGQVGDGVFQVVDITNSVSVFSFTEPSFTNTPGETPVTISVSRNNPYFADAINLNVADAAYTSFFSPVPATLFFAAGQSVATFDVVRIQAAPTSGPLVASGTAFSVTLVDSVVSGTLTRVGLTALATATTDTLLGIVSLTVANQTIPEGAPGQVTNGAFTLQLSRAVPAPLTVDVSILPSEPVRATFGADFTVETVTSVTIPAGATSVTIPFQIIGDAEVEPTESVIIILSNPSLPYVILGNTSAFVDIVNDDTTPPPPPPPPPPTPTPTPPPPFVAASASTITDPTLARRLSLQVTGSSGNDVILVRRSVARATRGRIEVLVNDTVLGTFTSRLYRVFVSAGTGNDDVTISPRISFPSVLAGDDGDDTLRGSSGRDLIIGGTGVNHLFGNRGDDLLFVETVPPEITASNAQIHTLLLSSSSYTRRSSRIFTLAPGALYFSNEPVRPQFPGVLSGGAGNDLFFRGDATAVLDRTRRELVFS